MEPLSAGAAVAGIAGGSINTLKTATTGTRSAFRKLRIAGIYDPKWLDLGLTSADKTISFDSDDAKDIELFLASERMKPVLTFIAVAVMYPLHEQKHELMDTALNLFTDEAKRWNIAGGKIWHRSTEKIWERLLELYSGALPSVADTVGLAEEVEAYSKFLSSSILPESFSSVAESFTQSLIQLASNPAALNQTATLASDLASRIQAAGHAPIISHADLSHAIDFRSQYVNRDFVKIDTNQTEESVGLISSYNPFRMVILGPPGAGKTTFVSHLVTGLASPELRNPPLPSAVVRCRDYANSNWSHSITLYITEKLQAELSKSMHPSDIEKLLLIGSLVVVFDGLDEITDKLRRGEMVKRIQGFSSQYPAASILITSREVGYQHAPLNRYLFRHVRLQEFSEGQVREYCEKWFQGNGRPDLVENFLSDSESVRDLRTNPLLLSLLCLLYKERGAIPANRRGIYHQCATLLFHRWDAHRQVTQHEAMPEYGDRLMQEIARWFYNSSNEHLGFEEEKIVKIISNYMETIIGFQPGKAESSARDFLRFCADRAWLLGDVGTSPSGERLFAFTHRTFFEFFIAEGFARQAASVGDAAQAILDAYRRDSTSVVPELLIQSYDFVRDRGASEVFDLLCLADTSPLLLLRLMEGAILAPAARGKAFDAITQRKPVSLESEMFTALLSINALAREHFVSEYLLDVSRYSFRKAFILGWAGLQLSGTGAVHERIWNPIIEVLLEKFHSEVTAMDDPVIINWLVSMGRSTKRLPSAWDYVVCESIFGWVPGCIWWQIDARLSRGIVGPENRQNRTIQKRVRQDFLWAAGFNPLAIRRLSEAIKPTQVGRTPWPSPGLLDQEAKDLRDILAVLVFLSVERRPDDDMLATAVDSCWAGGMKSVVTVRRWYKDRNEQPPSNPVRVRAAATRSELPERCKKWSDGRLNWVRERAPYPFAQSPDDYV